MRYVISYDLFKRDDYQQVNSRLEEIGAQRVLFSQWILTDDETDAEVVGKRIASVLQLRSRDRLLVTCLDSSGFYVKNPMVEVR